MVDLELGSKWQLVQLSNNMQPCYGLIALEYNNEVVLFGGVREKVMSIFNKNGDLIHSAYYAKNIPQYVSWGSAIVKENKIYAAGKEEKWKMFKYEKSTWQKT